MGPYLFCLYSGGIVGHMSNFDQFCLLQYGAAFRIQQSLEFTVDSKYFINDEIYGIVLILFNCLLIHSDGETFISADDLRINLWNLEINSQSFNIVDVKPTNMEDLTGNSTNLVLPFILSYAIVVL